jgi:hypothetical protein
MNTLQKSVIINGDKTLFLSKRAIERIKKDAKTKNLNDLDSSNYLQEGFKLEFTNNENEIKVNIVKTEDKLKQEKRDMLKQKLRGKYTKSKNFISSKVDIPKPILKAYNDLYKVTRNNAIPSPDIILQDSDKYKEQISFMMNSKFNINKNNKVNQLVRNYYRELGNHLNITATEFDPEYLRQINNSTNNNSQNTIEDLDTEDEDDEPCELIEIN